MVSPRSSYVTAGLTFLPGAADKRVPARKRFSRAGQPVLARFRCILQGNQDAEAAREDVSCPAKALACDVY